MDAVRDDVIGMLFGITSDAVIVLEDRRIVAWNAAAEQLFGTSEAQARTGGVTGADAYLDLLLRLPSVGPSQRLLLDPVGVVDATHRLLGEQDVLVLQDVTAVVRREAGLRRIARLSQEVMTGPRSLAATLQTLVTEAKQLAGADFSALLLLREGSATESSHFVYDAPRHLFPPRMPRAVGLLAVPIDSHAPARLSDIRGHPAGVGLPGVHPPIGPLIAIPLIVAGQVIGEVAVANSPERPAFDALDESLLTDLAAFIVVAIRWAQAAEDRQATVRRRQELMDAARHDIRTPLGAGKGYASLLATRLDRMSPEQVSTAVAGLTVAFDRIEAFSATLLVEDREDAPGAALRWQVVDVVSLLEQVRRDAAVMSGREQAVVVQREPGAPQVLAGDAEQVRAVLDNLVGNALTYAGHAGPVTVTVRAEGDQVRLDVRDLGPGIAEDEQAGLFAPGVHTSAGLRSGPAGGGRGLSIVRRLVRAHGGLLGVSSRPGEGATFWVTFPAHLPPQEQARAS